MTTLNQNGPWLYTNSTAAKVKSNIRRYMYSPIKGKDKFDCVATIPGADCLDLKYGLQIGAIDRSTRVVAWEYTPTKDRWRNLDAVSRFLMKNFDEYYLFDQPLQNTVSVHPELHKRPIDLAFFDTCSCLLFPEFAFFNGLIKCIGNPDNHDKGGFRIGYTFTTTHRNRVYVDRFLQMTNRYICNDVASKVINCNANWAHRLLPHNKRIIHPVTEIAWYNSQLLCTASAHREFTMDCNVAYRLNRRTMQFVGMTYSHNHITLPAHYSRIGYAAEQSHNKRLQGAAARKANRTRKYSVKHRAISKEAMNNLVRRATVANKAS